MEKIFPEKEVPDDSLLLALNNPDGATGDLDSLVNAPSEKIYNYNVEQANYNRLFGKYLYKPPPPEEELIEDEVSDTNAAPTGEPASEMTRKERRQAKKEEKARKKEENRLQRQQEATDLPE